MRESHGHAVKAKSLRNPVYAIWCGMKQRCLNPRCHSYPVYGGSGISIHPSWVASFTTFLRDVGPRPPGMSLDRYPDPYGNYEPGNVRWATPLEQAHNRRKRKRTHAEAAESRATMLEAFGKRMSLNAWARETGQDISTLIHRLSSGVPADVALSAPRRLGIRLRRLGHTQQCRDKCGRLAAAGLARCDECIARIKAGSGKGHAAGERHPCAKLKADDVRSIRARRASGVGTQALANEYGVSRTLIQRIVRGDVWRSLDKEAP